MLGVFVTNNRIDVVDSARGNAEETGRRGQIGGFLDGKSPLAALLDREEDLRGHRVPPGRTEKRLNHLGFGDNRFGRIGNVGSNVIGNDDLQWIKKMDRTAHCIRFAIFVR